MTLNIYINNSKRSYVCRGSGTGVAWVNVTLHFGGDDFAVPPHFSMNDSLRFLSQAKFISMKIKPP